MALEDSSDHRLCTSKRYLKKPPLLLRDYLLDDFGSCSSNGFKSFPRRQCCSTAAARFLLHTEIKRSRFSVSRSTTCGTALGFAVQKASTALVNAVKRLPFPSSVKPSPRLQVVLSRSFSKRLLLRRSFWRKCDDHFRRENDDGEIGQREDSDQQRQITFADFLLESLDQPSDQISSLSTAVGSTYSANTGCEDGGNSWEYESLFFTNSDAVNSYTSGESEVSNETDSIEEEKDVSGGIQMAGERLDAHVGDGSAVNRSLCTEDSKQECVAEEKEQFSPVSVLECHFDDDKERRPPRHQNPSLIKEIDKKFKKKGKRFKSGLVQFEPVDLEKRIDWYTKRQELVETGGGHCPNDQTSARTSLPSDDHNAEKYETDELRKAHRLMSRVKSEIDEPSSRSLIDNVSDKLLQDFFQEEDASEIKEEEEERLVKIVEERLLGRTKEMILSWEVTENRKVYVKEMERKVKWGCLEDEKDEVVEDLENGFFTALVEDLMVDMLLF